MSRMILDQESGQWVNERFQHIAEIINDWDPRLRLLWIPEGIRQPNEAPYAVGFFETEFQPPHIILFVEERELDERLIAKLFDMRDHAKDPNKILENMEAAKAIVKAKAEMERQEELAEKARAMIQTNKHSWTDWNGKRHNL